MKDCRIVDLEVHPIKDYGDTAALANSDDDADYFSLFGRVDGENHDYFVCIGDYPTRDAAMLTKELLAQQEEQGLPQP